MRPADEATCRGERPRASLHSTEIPHLSGINTTTARPQYRRERERESDLKYSRRALSSPAAAKVFILRGPSGTVSLQPLREFTRMLIMLSCCPSSPSSRGVRPTETEPPSPKTACEVFHGSSVVHLRHPAVPGHAQFRAKTSRALHGLLLRRHAAQSAHDPSFSR